MPRNVGYLRRSIVSDHLMKINWFIFTVAKTEKLELPFFRKWEIHPGYGEKLCVKKKKNPSQQHWAAEPLDFVFLHGLRCIPITFQNKQYGTCLGNSPSPTGTAQALNRREWQGIKK